MSVCVYSMGFIGPVSVVLFFIISTVVNKFLMSPVVALVFLQEQLEGDLRCGVVSGCHLELVLTLNECLFVCLFVRLFYYQPRILHYNVISDVSFV